MRVYIDDIEFGVEERGITLPGYRFSTLRDIEGWRRGAEVVVEVKATEQGQDIFGASEEMYRTEQFNDSLHSARIEADGVEIFSGSATLIATERTASGVTYRIRIGKGGAEWADLAATTQLKDTAIEIDRRMNMADVEASWSEETPVRMLPLNRDSYAEEAATGVLRPQQTLLPQDYHPFISIRAIIESIAQSSGYEICSNFLNSTLAQRLMISGAYKRVETEQAYATMGFKALRTTTNTATASPIGRVDAWKPIGDSNVGPVADSANPNSQYENGEPCTGAYNNGGCFVLENGAPTFRPKREISTAFDIHLHYTTDYKIVSSTKLQGFDVIYLGNECYVDVGLQNPYHDCRNEITTGSRYKLFIFDYDPAKNYMLSGVGTITKAVTPIQFKSGSSTSPQLYAKNSTENSYALYDGDWAIYDGYVEETGTREVEVTIRTPFEQLSPSSPKVFNQIYFYGAKEGMQLTLHAGCSITPIFGGTVGYDERIGFADIANHEISQADILEAIAHLFNLCIYTHRPSKRIYIEPYDSFFDGGEVDWRDREIGDDIVIEECAAESFAVTRLGYQPSDGATKRLTDGDSEFGTWSHISSSYATKQSVASRLNPLLMATASMQGAIGSAPSAAVMTVGNRDLVENSDYIKPRIALYNGMKPLPAGEYWPTVYTLQSYPLVAFHALESGTTLCFEDRDGCTGLHHYYDNQISEEHNRQRITLDIALSPTEYIALFDPDSHSATIRSRFRLGIGGNSSLFRLDEILSYDAERGVARCRFQRMIVD